MKILKYFLIICLLPPATFAEVFVRAADTEQGDYSAFLAAYNHQSWSDWWIRNRLPKSARAEIKARLLAAQSEFLKGGVAQAEEKFESVLELELKQDWRGQDRAAFAYSALRLAQISQDLERRTRFVRLAARWGKVDLSSDLFPALIWTAYENELKLKLNENLDLDLYFPGATYLLVDGRPLRILEGARWPIDSSEHRFTLVYDHAPATTRITTWEKLKDWRPQPKPFAAGSCDRPQRSPELPAHIQIFFSVECRPSPSKNPMAPVARTDLLPTPVSEIKSPPKNYKWLWIVAGATLAAALITMSDRDKENSSPGTTVGF